MTIRYAAPPIQTCVRCAYRPLNLLEFNAYLFPQFLNLCIGALRGDSGVVDDITQVTKEAVMRTVRHSGRLSSREASVYQFKEAEGGGTIIYCTKHRDMHIINDFETITRLGATNQAIPKVTIPRNNNALSCKYLPDG